MEELRPEDCIYIGCDDSGFEAKTWIIDYLKCHGYAWKDCGGGEEASRYPYYAARVAAAVSRGEIRRGILICGTGIGMSIAANRFPHVRASVVTDAYSARLTRRHNDSNILCLGGQMLGRWQLIQILETWLTTEYDGGHHQESLELLTQMDEVMSSGNLWCPQEIPYQPFTWNPEQQL